MNTIILPELPHLEWVVDNLTGFGGREIAGYYYYTYDEAQEALRQLGDGWRLPTCGEGFDLMGLHHEWLDNGTSGLPGLLLSGALFLPACGSNSAWDNCLFGVGVLGKYWESAHSYGKPKFGLLDFSKESFCSLPAAVATAWHPVRCVRSVVVR